MTVVVDTSAIVAILFAEPEREPFRNRLEALDGALSAGTLIETLRVVGRRRPPLRPSVYRILERNNVRIVNVDSDQVRLADQGNAQFGKGRGAPPAVLNFGDLFAYALARQLDAPLLYKGDDFTHTDVRPALTV